MLVFVPQGFVALVFVDGKPFTVLEAGVGVVPVRGADLQVQFVDLQPQPPQLPEEAELD